MVAEGAVCLSSFIGGVNMGIGGVFPHYTEYGPKTIEYNRKVTQSRSWSEGVVTRWVNGDIS